MNRKALLVLGTLVGCTDDMMSAEEQAVASRHIVSCANALPASFANTVANRGDDLHHHHAAAGFAVVTTATPSAYATASCTVVADVVRTWIAPARTYALSAQSINPPTSGDDDFLFDTQWGHDAVDAPEAWLAGRRGQGVRVAVLDTGFDLTHPDLAPNINSTLSRDFTGEGLQWTRFGDVFSHGTHTAGTVAAADNGFGTIGVAPAAELVLVKVLRDDGNGSFGDMIAGMIYATDVDADVISMSLGALFPRVVAGRDNAFIGVVSRVATYARQRGTTVIAAVGNENMNLDSAWINLPSDAANVIGVSATAPHDWALDPSGSLDFRAGYSNFGSGSVELAGPGGDVYREPDFSQVCTVGVVSDVPCFVFDLVMSTGASDGFGPVWYWSAGTSMATPHVAGVAALLLGANPSMTPAQLEAALRTRATDLGQPGRDAYFGHGRVDSGF